MEKVSLIILAAGKGTRFIPLTNTIPKPLLKVAAKPAMQHQIDAALPYINEIIIVVGYLKEKIQEYFGDSYQGIPVKYIEQKKPIGSGDALKNVKDHISNAHFFLIYGDDIYDRSFFEKLISKENGAIGMKIERWQSYGIFQLNPDHTLINIVEKPKEFVGDLANIGVFKVTKEIFKYTESIPLSERGEYELTDVVSSYSKEFPMEIVEVEAGWMPLSYPWHILEITQKMLETNKTNIQGTVEEGATIKGTLILGKNSIIKTGAYLEGNFIIGENSSIGPNCYLKDFATIGNNTNIGNAVEITRSVIGDNTNIKHLSYVGDSIVGNNCNLGGGTIIANVKHSKTGVKMKVDEPENVKVIINDKLVDSGRTKLGAVMGDFVKTGIHTSVYPGRKLWNGTWTLPGEVVSQDKK